MWYHLLHTRCPANLPEADQNRRKTIVPSMVSCGDDGKLTRAPRNLRQISLGTTSPPSSTTNFRLNSVGKNLDFGGCNLQICSIVTRIRPSNLLKLRLGRGLAFKSGGCSASVGVLTPSGYRLMFWSQTNSALTAFHTQRILPTRGFGTKKETDTLSHASLILHMLCYTL
jgi:hypothetical protein